MTMVAWVQGRGSRTASGAPDFDIDAYLNELSSRSSSVPAGSNRASAVGRGSDLSLDEVDELLDPTKSKPTASTKLAQPIDPSREKARAGEPVSQLDRTARWLRCF